MSFVEILNKILLAGAHKKLQRGKHPEMHLLGLKVQIKGKRELSKHYLSLFSSVSDGIYHLKSNETGEIYSVYCHMSSLSTKCGGGGWTLVMKLDRDKVKPSCDIYIHTYIHTYIHIYIHIHTYIHTYMQNPVTHTT